MDLEEEREQVIIIKSINNDNVKKQYELTTAQAFNSELIKGSLSIELQNNNYVATGDTNELLFHIPTPKSYKNKLEECISFLKKFPNIQSEKFKISNNLKHVMKDKLRIECLELFNLPLNLNDKHNCKLTQEQAEKERTRLSEIVTCANFMGIQPLVVIMCYFIVCIVNIQLVTP